MSTKPRTGIEIDANEKPAVAGLKRLVKGFGEAATQINQSLEVLGKAWGVVSGVVGGVGGAIKEATQLAAEQERVELRAIAAIRTKNEFSRAEFEILQASNAERQRLLGLGDETQLQLQGTLAIMGVGKDQLSAATDAAAGLAGAFGIDLAEAGKKVGKVLAGNYGELAEFGIQVKSLDEAQKALNETWQITQAQAGTLTTRLTALDAAWGDLKEVLGGAVNSSKAASEITLALTDALVDLTNFLGSPEGRGAINSFFQAFASGLSITASVGENLVNVWDFWRKRFTTAFGGVVVEQLDERGQTNIERLKASLLDLEKVFDRISAGGLGAGGTTPKALGKLTGTTGQTGNLVPEGPALVPSLMSSYDPNLLERNTLLMAGAPLPERLMTSEEKTRRQNAIDEAIEGVAKVGQDYRARLEAENANISLQLAQEQQAADAIKPWVDIGTGALTTVANNFATMFTSIIDGSMSAGEALKSFAGTTIMSIGQMAFQLGTAAVLAGTLGAISPFFAPLTGLSVGAGVALMAGGLAMMGVGAAMGGRGTSAGSGASVGAGGGGAGSTSPTAFDPFRGLNGPGNSQGSQGSMVVNLTFNAPVAGDSRRFARDVEDIFRNAGRPLRFA